MPTGHSRAILRQELLEKMRSNSAAGVDCARCAGTCCTFVANSMEISEGEAEDIVTSLRANGAPLQSVAAAMQIAIDKYRLEACVPGNGRRPYLRRTYTCPFYRGTALGCSIPAESKPLGCLNFNPRVKHLVEGGDCGLSIPNLVNAESTKQPIPIAVKEAIRRSLGDEPA